MNNKIQKLIRIIENLPNGAKEREFVRVALQYDSQGRPDYLKLVK